MRRIVRLPRAKMAGIMLGFVTLGALNLGYAHGQVSTCRTDPVVTLSNGVQITMYEDVSDVASDITRVTYQLHVPSGVKITSISYPGAVPANLQSVKLSQDENPGDYDAYTVVSTKTPNIAVTAYMSAAASGTTTVSCHTSGQSGQTLHSHVHL